MKRLLSPLAAAALIAGVTTASAGPWGGFYAGIHAGYGTGDTDWTFNNFGSSADHDIDGALGGVQLGWNHEMGSFVLGAEVDAQIANINGSTDCPGPGFTCESSIDHAGSARVRAGYATGDWLFYGTGGFAVAETSAGTFVTSDGSLAFSDDEILTGWTAGAGVEYIWSPAISVRGEWRYTDLGSETRDVSVFPVDVSKVSHEYHQFTIGLNWHF